MDKLALGAIAELYSENKIDEKPTLETWRQPLFSPAARSFDPTLKVAPSRLPHLLKGLHVRVVRFSTLFNNIVVKCPCVGCQGTCRETGWAQQIRADGQTQKPLRRLLMSNGEVDLLLVMSRKCEQCNYSFTEIDGEFVAKQPDFIKAEIPFDAAFNILGSRTDGSTGPSRRGIILDKALGRSLVGASTEGLNFSEVSRRIDRINSLRFQEAKLAYESSLSTYQAMKAARSGSSSRGQRASYSASTSRFDPNGSLLRSYSSYLSLSATQLQDFFESSESFQSIFIKAATLPSDKEYKVYLGGDGNVTMAKKCGVLKREGKNFWFCLVDSVTKEVLASEFIPSESTINIKSVIDKLPSNFIIMSLSFDVVGDVSSSELQAYVAQRQGGRVPEIFQDNFHPIKVSVVTQCHVLSCALHVLAL